MRVIGGKYKRRTLCTVDGRDITRPTSDRVKENIFNIINAEIEDSVVLDLFSGSGALGIEALSRGAKKVIFVEKHRVALACIQKNLDALDIPKSCYTLVASDVSLFLAQFGLKNEEKANIIFADPPYQSTWYSTALSQIEAAHICAQGALVILEMSTKFPVSDFNAPPCWQHEQTRRYGETQIEFWRLNP